MQTDNTSSPSIGLRRWLLDHPGFLFSGLYVLASVIGMGFSWGFLHQFGINVFYYAEISDFMLASLREPLTWGLVVFALLVVAGDNTLSKQVAKKKPRRWLSWYASRRYRLFNYFVALQLCIVFIYAFASNKAEDVRAGKGDVVVVTLADGTAQEEMVLLGTTGQFLFLFQRENGRVFIHPHEAILTIQQPKS